MDELCRHCGESREATIHDRNFCMGHYCEFEPEPDCPGCGDIGSDRPAEPGIEAGLCDSCYRSATREPSDSDIYREPPTTWEDSKEYRSDFGRIPL